MKLSNRLSKIASFVTYGSMVADIGTDHGYIPVYLIKNNIVKVAIASDVSSGSLMKIINYVKENKLEESINIRLGDGLSVLKPFEVDTTIIAGMGGLLIQDILEKDKEITNSITNFILQPMVASVELRKYLINNEFKIIDEELAKEGNKFYEIIHARKGKDTVENQFDYLLNPRLVRRKHPLLEGFIISKLKILKKIKKQLEGSHNYRSSNKYKEINKHMDFYKEVLNNIES